jgi:hypothetical protein
MLVITHEEWTNRFITRNGKEYKLNNIRLCETYMRGVSEQYYEFDLLNGKEIVTGKCNVQDKYLLDEHRWHINSNLVKSTFDGKPIIFARMVMNAGNCNIKYVNDNDHFDLRRSNLFAQKKSKLIESNLQVKSFVVDADEKWMSLKELGHPNYSVSDQGNVRNVVRGYNLKQTTDDHGKGYQRVCLCTNNIKKMMFVHQLVGRTFLKDSKGNKSGVDHIDRNPKNNKLINLRWATAKEQAANMVRGATGAKRQVNQYDLDGNFIKFWNSVKEAQIATGIFGTLICRACRDKQDDAGGFKWKYTDVADGDAPDEIWKEVNYEDCELITVSNKGRVIMKNGRKSIGNPSGGYLDIDIKSLETGNPRTFRVHRIVMAAFNGENPTMIVNHLDGIRTNNCLENLEYLTQQGNVLHAIKMGLTQKGQRGGRKVLLTNADGEETEYESMLACAKATGISRTVISTMCKDGSKHNEGYTCRRL